MPAAWKRQIHDDIRKAIAEGCAGHTCDIRQWERIEVGAVPVKSDRLGVHLAFAQVLLDSFYELSGHGIADPVDRHHHRPQGSSIACFLRVRWPSGLAHRHTPNSSELPPKRRKEKVIR